MKEEDKKIKRVIIERKYFVCEGFGHIAYYYRNIKEEELILIPSNKFEVSKSRMIQKEKRSKKEIGKDKKTILRQERLKRKKLVKI